MTTTPPSFAATVAEDAAIKSRITAADARDHAKAAVEIMLVTVQQAGQALHLTPREVEQLIDAGQLECWKIGNRYRVPIEDLRRFAKTGPTEIGINAR